MMGTAPLYTYAGMSSCTGFDRVVVIFVGEESSLQVLGRIPPSLECKLVPTAAVWSITTPNVPLLLGDVDP